ncbi:unnamed protein product [Durusdinium trenchii]|uniref:Uncharacterized protein n=1 Tax=Durusdinium trenchii TaxID=1381693 RepID=A0ABP0I5X7_9DINO
MSQRRIRSNLITFNAIISATERASWSSSLTLFTEIHQRRITDVNQQAASYNLLVTSRRHWPWTQLLLAQMKAHGLKQHILSYNAAGSSCAQSFEWHHAAHLLSHLRGRGLETQLVTVNSLLSALDLVDLWRSSLQLLRAAARRGGADDVAFNSATSAMVHWRKALHLQCSQRCWEASDTSGSSVGPNALLAKVEQWPLALELVKDRPENGWDLVGFNTFLDVLKASWCHALHVLKEIPPSRLQIDLLSFNAAVEACSQSLQWSQVLLLLQDLQSCQMMPSVLTLDAALRALQSRWLK